MSAAELNPFVLAAVTPDPDPRLLPLLRSKPSLASLQDGHGYSLLHAAASYNHISLLRNLVSELNVNVNLVDEDGETCLFVAEQVDIAKCLIEELKIDTLIKNEDGLTARERIEIDGEWPDVAAYLKAHETASMRAVSNGAPQNGTGLSHPPPLPPNIRLDINTMNESSMHRAELPEPDPDFKRRIEELAARDNFHTDEGQRELRDLITDAVRGVSGEERDVRRRAN